MSLRSLLAHARVVERRVPLDAGEVRALGELPKETARFAEKRLVEFLLGRHAAKAALASLGLDVGVLPIQAERAPGWPVGIIGSITHCTGYAGAAVARASDLRGVGVDAQPVPDAKSRAALQRTATDDEVALLRLDDEMIGRTVAFSAKESLYNALAPTVGGYFGFEAARITRADHGTAVLELTRDLHPLLGAGSTFLVHYAVIDRVVYAAIEWR
ncbi:4'-phosphopantetheinyl transferase [soil metagenome]